MAKYEVTYPDGSTDQLTHSGKAKQLFEQLFSHLPEEVREKCKVVTVKAAVTDADKEAGAAEGK